MQRNDYQDALNELRLSSKFCEEMEKKLSAQVTEDDEYTDEVTHVEVVPQRNYRKLALAAAFVLAIGGAGGGALYMNRDAFLDSSGTERTIYDEKTFSFPFGSVDLHGTVFNYSCQGVLSGGTTVADQEMGGELQGLFASTEFREMEPNIVSSDFDGERISFSTSDYYADFYGDGLIVVEDMSQATAVYSAFGDTIYQDTKKYYKMDPEVFQKMKQILYKNEKLGIIDAMGVNADIYNADIIMETRNDKLTSREAIQLAVTVNCIQWNKKKKPVDTAGAESITIKFTKEAAKYELIFYSNGNAVVNTTKGSKTDTAYYSIGDNPNGYIEIKSCVDNGSPCSSPFKYEKEETACASIFETYYGAIDFPESNNNSCILKDGDFTKLIDMFEDFNWRRSVGYDPVISCDIYIATTSQRLTISSGGVCTYYDYNDTSAEMGEYGLIRYYIDEAEYNALRNWLLSIGDYAKNANELAESSINRSLGGQGVNLRYVRYQSEGQTAELFSSKGAQELKSALMELDWKLTDEYLPCRSNCYEVYSSGYYPPLILSRDGLMIDDELMISYKCEEPEKYIEIIDELFSKNETINEKYQKLLPDDKSDS